jgi:hypothetical protein
LVKPTPTTPAPGPTPVPDDDCEDDDDENDDDQHGGDYQDGDDDQDEDCDDEPTPYPDPVTPKPTPKPITTPPAPSPPKPSTTTTTKDPKPSPVENPSSETHTDGHVTWYTQNGNAGACGNKHSDNDFIAALDFRTYGNTSARSKYCGKKIRVSWQGKSVDVVVEDACPSCANSASVDLSTAAFKALAPLSVGELKGVTWQLL